MVDSFGKRFMSRNRFDDDEADDSIRSKKRKQALKDQRTAKAARKDYIYLEPVDDNNSTTHEDDYGTDSDT